MKHLLYFIWQNKCYSALWEQIWEQKNSVSLNSVVNKETRIVNLFQKQHSKFLAQKIFTLVKENFYTQLEAQLEQSASQNNWNSSFIVVKGIEIEAFLNAKEVFDTVEIDFIFVKESLRGQGYSQILLAVLEQMCRGLDPPVIPHAAPPVIPRLDRGIQRILLEVGEKNSAAVNLYIKCGFKKISVRKNYYKGTENALIMEKIL